MFSADCLLRINCFSVNIFPHMTRGMSFHTSSNFVRLFENNLCRRFMILLLLEFHEVLSKYILLTPWSMNRYTNLNPKEGKKACLWYHNLHISMSPSTAAKIKWHYSKSFYSKHWLKEAQQKIDQYYSPCNLNSRQIGGLVHCSMIKLQLKALFWLHINPTNQKVKLFPFCDGKKYNKSW